LIGLAGIVGVSLVGRLAEPGNPSVPAETAGLAPVAAIPPAPTDLPSLPEPSPEELVVITSPAEGDPTITAPELIVQGFLQAEAAQLSVSLETDWYQVEEAMIVPALAFAERPAATRHAQFLVRFGLSEPRLSGPMVVRVVALDAEGHQLADVQRPFRLGPIERPALGDDGLLGGLVFSGL
jgi:hypothetical protein